MTKADLGPILRGQYSHDLLLHDCDEDLVAATRAFVEQGLASDGRVLVHSCEERLAMLRGQLGSHPRLEYGLDRDLYQSPSTTMFGYERALERDPTELWVTGTVPLGDDPAGHHAWLHYESLVNELLSGFAFHALCTYDTRTVPRGTIAAARATHPGLSAGGERTRCADYVKPAAFLTDPPTGWPDLRSMRPTIAITVQGLGDLRSARHLLARSAESASAVDRESIIGFTTAVHEVLVNALTHGGPPVDLTVWAETARLTCQVTDNGPGIPDDFFGYQHPTPNAALGLWAARHLCDELIVINEPGGGCGVIMTIA